MDILILLLGGNPLPNFITADYLLNPDRNDQDGLPVPGKILFVSTERTEKFYNSIINLLRKKHSENFPHTEEIKLNDKHRLPKTIQDKIKETLKNHNSINSIHLSYTGGTKPMAANAFAAAIEVAQEKIKLILSDLDPDNFKLTSLITTSNNKMIEKNFPGSVCEDLRDYVHLNIDEIFDLHGMVKKEEELKKFNIDTIQFSLKMASDYKKGTKRNQFLNICKEIAQDDPKLNEKIVSNHPYLKGIFDENFNRRITPGQFFHFINGKWLEYYIYTGLEEIKNEHNLLIEMNIEAQYEKRKCEIDVIAVKGHQMFLFSCTTSRGIKLVKQKAFEALFRAEQLGGEHAKVIVVSTMFNIPCEAKLSWKNNLKELEKDIKQFNADQKCELIGIDELSNEKEFLRKLKDIITQN